MTMRGTIKAVALDVGGTLIEPWPSVGHIYAEVAARHGWTDFSPEVLNARFRAAWKSNAGFDYSRTGWEKLVNATFGTAADGSSGVPFFSELYERFADPNAWRVFDDVRPAVRALESAGIRLAVISNWDERLRPLLRRLDLLDCFESVVISCEVGFEKPSPLIFKCAAAQLRLPEASILHIGDSLEFDALGGQRAGFESLHLRRGFERCGAGEIRSLTEVPMRLAERIRCD